MAELRSFTDLLGISTFADRFRYLSLRGVVGAETFGSDRYLNQQFYRSAEWKSIRRAVILRDQGCDMGVPGFEIHDAVYIHHMNPMTVEDVMQRNDRNLDPEYLISVTLRTHNAIHYGDETQLAQPLVERSPGDTKLW